MKDGISDAAPSSEVASLQSCDSTANHDLRDQRGFEQVIKLGAITSVPCFSLMQGFVRLPCETLALSGCSSTWLTVVASAGRDSIQLPEPVDVLIRSPIFWKAAQTRNTTRACWRYGLISSI